MKHLTQTAKWRELHVRPDIWGEWAAALYVALAKVLAAIWSNGLGLNVDVPFASNGTLTREILDVTLHPAVPR